MKRLTITLIIAISAIWSMGAFAAGVGVVDMQKILSSSPEIKTINDKLTKQFQSRKDKIIKMGRALQNNLQSYQKNKSVMNQKDLAGLQKKIGEQEMQLRQAQMEYQKALFSAQNDEMKSFMDRIRSIVKKIAAKKKLDLVLPDNIVLYSDGEMDITSDVMSDLR